MYEIELLAVGDGEKSGDAITVRFTSPATGNTVIGVVDGGFTDTGPEVVAHVNQFYGTNTVDFVLSTHPDADHINGMGYVMRNLKVVTLLIHRPAQHGYPNNSGARPAEELVDLAAEQGAEVVEPFAGVNGFADAFLIAGPTELYYEQLLAQQEVTQKPAPRKLSLAERYLKEARVAAQRVVSKFPIEIAFGDAGGTNPRNNSSAIVSLLIDGKHILLLSDAGVPAITDALDLLDAGNRTASPPALFVLPHHGSRHNLDRHTIERILGAQASNTRGTAFASVSEESDLPSPRVANACGRRGYPVGLTRGFEYIRHATPDAPFRANLKPITPLPPLEETEHD